MPLVRQFEQLWKSTAAPPDVFSFLKHQKTSESDQWITILRSDQQRRWQTDKPLKVEDYIAGLPELPGNVDWKLQLAIGEFEARRDTNRPLSDQEISSRFPDLSETLRDRLRQVSSEDKPAAEKGGNGPNDSASQLAEIDRICDAFEAAWNDGSETPRMETFLKMVPSDARKTLFLELIKVELWWRKQQGQVPKSPDYEGRFPEHASLIREVLSQPIVSSRRQSRQASYLPAEGLIPTVIKPQSGPSSTVTYITGNAIGVQQKGRYRLDRVLGEGAFGRVYLGFDEELQRQVAIKVPTKARFQKPEDAEAYLAEARTVASLDHPHIVPVYDMGRTQDGSIYVVSKFIEGSTLEDRIKAGRPPERESTLLLVTVALALQHAHDRRLIHRDVKPANILLEGKSNAPYVADFGLAIREEDYLKQNAIAGTPAYMSPEQIRGEGHRLDGRSDIFSLGVILYELLTGKKPFRGSLTQETMHLVLTQEPRPPREVLDTIPAELERICLKALSKRTTDRYATAAEFADDLEQWLKPAAAVTQAKTAVQVVPKGLRSFDANDADFFLDLLPGQRNRDGLPESIAFWKQRIEQTDPEQTFSVGLIYGPSGCGKSSLVKAGLLPHLSEDVIAVYVEATPEDTETRILRGLQKRIEPQGASRGLMIPAPTPAGALPTSASAVPLTETLATIRRSHGPKVVIIIDQFEQWLHAHRAEPDAELVRALRQCDDGRLQAIVMVRDDFWLAASRFMNSIEIDLVAGHNISLVDLFDLEHAAKVLTKFGQAFGKLPANASKISEDERQFVGDVASGLAQDGNVVSVRLSLFAEMVKGKPWTAATLDQVGGTQGIGVNFLEETFVSRAANPKHRQHQEAARGVLRALLPELDTDIKGSMRSHAELLEASGYVTTPVSGSALAAGAVPEHDVTTPVASAIPLRSSPDFNDLLRILDGELRLITPTDPEGDSVSGSSRDSSLATRYYQLTHDYLVPSLREWLTRKQKETRKGRAELKLAERSSLWNAKPENRHLPSLIEWLSIRTLTEAKNWTNPQRVMMRRGFRVHGIRTASATLIVLLLVFSGLSINKRINDRQEKLLTQKQEEQNQAEATRLVEGLLAANTAQVSTSLASLKDFRTWADPQLQQEFKDSAADSDAKLHAGLALVAEGQTVDPAVLEFLQERMLTITPGQFGPVRTMLEPHKADMIPSYWQLALNEEKPAALRFHAACALAAFDPDSAQAPMVPRSSLHAPDEDPSGANIRASWNDPIFSRFVAEQLVSVPPTIISQYQELVRPVAPHLVPPLSDIFADPARGELAKTLATSLLADYAAKDPDTLTKLVLAADAVSDKSLFPVLQQHQTVAVKNLEAVLDQRLEPDWKDAPLDPAWTEPTAAVRAQMETAHGLITDRFAFCQDMPLSQFLEIAETLRASGYRPTRVRPHQSLLPLGGGAVLSASARPTADAADRPDEGVANVAAAPALQVSAIWTRDGIRWHLYPSLKKSELPAADAPAIKDDRLLTDIAPLPLADEDTEPQFIAVWGEAPSADADANAPDADASGSEGEQRRVLLDVTEAELDAAQATFKQQGFASQSTITVRTNASVQRRYTGLWSNLGAPSELRPAYAGFELVEQPQWDVAVAPAAKLADPREPLRPRIAAIDQELHVSPENKRLRQTRGELHYFLGDDELAIQDFDTLFESGDRSEPLLRFRTFVLSRLGRDEDAISCRELYLNGNPGIVSRLFVQVTSIAWLGNETEALLQLADFKAANNQNIDMLYAAAASSSLASLPSKHNLKGSAVLQSRAVELLRDAVRQGFNNYESLRTDYDLVPLYGTEGFQALLSELAPPATYAALWHADVEYDSKLLTSVPVDGLLEQLKPLLAAGWCPFSIAVSGVGFQPATATTEDAVVPEEKAGWKPTPLLCSLVLHRPIIPDVAKETLALQQAAAATALLRLNAPDKVWPLFQDQPDPRLRSYVQHRLAAYGVDPQSLFTQLQQESDGSRQRSLILGIGEFARAKLLSPDQQTAVIADLTKRYADDPDPGIHGAAEWTLRQLGAETTIAEVKAAYSTGEAIGDRRWYLTKTSGKSSSSDVPPAASSLSFAIIDAADEFLMGSPVTEIDRFHGGPTGKFEIRHRRRIGRRFAIGTHEITVAQFQAFRSDHPFDRTKSREDDSPANMITWYDAAAYCNWLSKEEGLPPKEWCYDPDQPFAEGMPLVSDYLQRKGYRLPSEAEWEYACRAGTTSARYFGETETLLGEYAWYTKTSGDKWMLPVGTLRPNGAGLFDMQGNLQEWCQDSPFYYNTSREWMGDKEKTGNLSNSGTRVLRGGSFAHVASLVRSADRYSERPVIRFHTSGFRVGRTLWPLPLAALPPAEGGSKFEK